MRKLKRKFIKEFTTCEDKVGEFIARHIITVAFVLVVAVAIICVKGHGRSWLMPCGGVIGGCMVMYQWYSDRRVKRAELLRELLNRYNQFDIEKLLRGAVTSDSKEECERESDEGIFDLLSFLNYVCHLFRSSILTESEFSSLKWDVVRTLENRNITELIGDVYQGAEIGDRPYHDLLIIGAENCEECVARVYLELLSLGSHNDGGGVEKQNSRIVDSVGSGKTYPNHLAVLNGIFRLGYRGHMRGAARLRNGAIVWFPKYRAEDKEVERNDNYQWLNVISKDEKTMWEYWPKDTVRPNDSSHGTGKRRYVFGVNLGERKQFSYVFLGVFQQKGDGDDEKKCFVYERIAVTIAEKDVNDAEEALCM